MTETMTFETDRMRFIGRGRDAGNPQALEDGASLSGTVGPVLDAVAAIRVPFVLEAGGSITIDWLTGVATTREACVALAQKVRKAQAARQILQQAGAYRRALLRRLGAHDTDAVLYQRMAVSVAYGTAGLRANADVIEKNRRGPSGLWGFGVSGDVPVVLLALTGPKLTIVIQQMVRAHAYWAAFGLRNELAVLCTPSTSTDDEPRLFDRVRQEIDAGPGAALIGKPGGVFVLDGTTLDEGDRILLQSVARIVITDANELSAELVGLVRRSTCRARAACNVLTR